MESSEPSKLYFTLQIVEILKRVHKLLKKKLLVRIPNNQLGVEFTDNDCKPLTLDLKKNYLETKIINYRKDPNGVFGNTFYLEIDRLCCKTLRFEIYKHHSIVKDKLKAYAELDLSKILNNSFNEDRIHINLFDSKTNEKLDSFLAFRLTSHKRKNVPKPEVTNDMKIEENKLNNPHFWYYIYDPNADPWENAGADELSDDSNSSGGSG